MNPNEQFILMVIVSLVVATMIGLAWMKFSLFIGAVLRRRYTKIGYMTQESGIPSNLNNSSYHSGNQRQQCDQQINPTYGIKGIYKSYYLWVVGFIDRILQPLYWYINTTPQKQHQDTKASNKNNARNLKGFIHTDNLPKDVKTCQPKKNDTPAIYLSTSSSTFR